MSKSNSEIPTYRGHTTTWQASSCAPMRKAAAENRIEVKAITHGHYYGTTLADDLLPGVCTVGYWNAKTDQDWKLSWHRNEGLELDFQESGTNGFATVDQQTELHAGDLAVVRPWQLHQCGVPNVRRGIRTWIILDVGITNPNSKWQWPAWIALTEQDKNKLSSILLSSCNPVFHLSRNHLVHWKTLLKELRSEKKDLNYSLIAITINAVLYSLIELSEDQGKFVPSDRPLALRIIQDFLRDFEVRPHLLLQNWTVSEMARQCGMSPAGFCIHFRECTNMSPNQYLNFARIRRAQELLKEYPDYPIAHLATDVGFTTSQYFATVFKRITGKTPSAYVEEISRKKRTV